MPDNVKVSQLPAAAAVNDTDLLLVSELVDGNYISKKVTGAQLNSFVQNQLRAVITVTSPGASVTDDWFTGKTVFEIVASGLTYFKDMDFTQTGNTITFINTMTFYATQQIVAKI